MFKKFAIAAPLAALALGSSVVFAASETRHTIQLTAHVPTKTFHVQPVDPDLVIRDQVLSYNPATGDLSTLRAAFDTRHTAGAIEASLESAATLFNGSDTVPLTVKFNGKDLKVGTAQEVLSEADAAAGRRVDLEIIPTKPADGYAAGDYTGTVSMIFDAVAA
ncbi:CS1 type fimbrial major subunit [Pseudomonas brassicacearum]|uniref:Adhesin n=1 Tax=Pseudomonas brassicacearum TaxID=930166 RepID=A0A423GNL3_9PSED|nr:CS1 type fimbrial major subunit [Pseudomonas brassicacearum]ROM93893.1 hypothetical protein BK658_19750 [Pseudomonas brassicacearum]